MAVATLPTPPAAPVTSTSPPSGRSPFASSARTASIAVKPAVPIAIVSASARPSGTGTSHSPRTRALPA